MSKSIEHERLLYFEPNLGENSNQNIEDLSIFVELETISKNRTMVSDRDIVNLGTNNTVIRFIGGKDNDVNKSLTTNFTINDDKFTDGKDTLGIETIDIDFDTAYTPLVKIKFIDVRGQSILTKGNDSDYRMFFELPYPIFKLTIKGYYGRPVTYCLHLLKWNSKFNASTGNFEIYGEFIGYTYAKLTDLLMGYIRATVETSEGVNIYNEIKQEYANKGIVIKTINEFLIDTEKISDEFRKLKEEDVNVKKLNTIQLIKDGIRSIEIELKRLTSLMVKDNQNGFNDGLGVLGVDSIGFSDEISGVINNILEIDKEIINTKANINKIINDSETGLNVKIGISNLTLNSKKLTDIIKLNGLKHSDFEDIEGGADAIQRTNPKVYSLIDPSSVNSLSKTINTNINGTNTEKNIVIYDMRVVNDEIKLFNKKLDTFEEDLRTKVGVDLANIAKQTLSFEPTIRNIIRIFTIHCEVFLRTLHKVSDDSVNSSGADERVRVLEGIGLDNKKSDLKADSPIYPWFEYNDYNEEDGYTETWVGSKLTVNDANKVHEVRFVEDLLDKLINLGEFDDRINNISPTELNFYPVSVLDTIFSEGLIENPYITALTKEGARTIPDEAIRCLILRGFLGLGFTNRRYPRKLAGIMGELEAYNMFNAFASMNKNKANELINNIRPRTSSVNSKVNETINKGLNGYDESILKNPKGVKRPFFNDGGDVYDYNYILDSTISRAYMPINGGFDGTIFYETVDSGVPNFKNYDDIRALSDKYVFTSNITNSDINNDEVSYDGAVLFKILDTGKYKNSTDNLNNGNEILGPDGQYRKLIPQGSVINESTIKNSVYGFKNLNVINPYEGSLMAQEILTIMGSDGTVKDVSRVYWNVGVNKYELISGRKAFKGGSYLCKLNDANELKPLIKSNTIETNKIGNGINQTRLLPGIWGNQKELVLDLIDGVDVENIYTPYIEFTSVYNTNNPTRNYSLFGHKFYYQQTSPQAKAFLFLHTFGWEGLIGEIGNDVSLFDSINSSDDDKPTIKGLYGINNSFIKAPRLWCAFIGGLLYRYERGEAGNDIINFDNNTLEYQTDDSIMPKHDEFLYNIETNSMFGITLSANDGSYGKIDNIIKNLPLQVKTEFVDTFLSFVSQDFEKIMNALEIPNLDNPNTFDAIWESMDELHNGDNISSIINKSDVRDIVNVEGYDVYDNYISFTSSFKNNLETTNSFSLMLKPNTSVSNLIRDLISNSVIIQNGSPRVFIETSHSDVGNYEGAYVKKDDYVQYLESFYTRFEKLAKKWDAGEEIEIDRVQEKIFKSTDDDLIKLNIYRSLSSIYNKWIGGTSDAIISDCGFNTNIIDSFKFLDKSFNDIGDKFFINPLVISDLITGNYNQSFFDIVNTILSNNNFNFIALPSFINFTDMSELKDMFKPFSYNDSLDDIVGPSFICTYTGQLSSNLDLGDDYQYGDDGVYIRENDSGSVTGIPVDFNESDGDSLKIPMVGVTYGLQNQSFFKDINLDQREFTETSETLQVIDDISMNGDKRKPTYVGQNLFNIYQTRAYSAEIEMMGNAMIQPMMYFQLNNIPMFKGAYMILKVSHQIKANNMTTKFKGVRIKGSKTELVKSSTIFMNLLGSLKSSGTADSITNSEVKIATNGVIDTYANWIDTPMTTNLLPINNDNKSEVAPSYLQPITPNERLRYGMREVIEHLQLSFKEFNEWAKTQDDVSETIFWNDVSYLNGGITSDHNSHQIGTNIDFRQIGVKGYVSNFSTTFFNDNMDLPNFNVLDSFDGYSRKGTDKLIEILMKNQNLKISGTEIKLPSIDIIYFNDPVLIDKYSKVKFYKGHHNHIHITYNIPERVELESKNPKPGENTRIFNGLG